MKRKPIKIDWDRLEEAFSTPEDEAVFYLDRVTGRVFMEGEEDVEPEDEDEAFEHARPVAGPVTPVEREDPTRIAIDPPETELKVDWMQEFLQQEGSEHGAVAGELTAAMAADDPAIALGEVLNRNPETREAWYRYRSDRLHDLIDDWLAENDIQCTDSPPWGR